MKRRRVAPCSLLLLALVQFGCGNDPRDDTRSSVVFELSQNGIHSIWKGEDELTAGTSGYYIVGACDTVDNFETNVTSVGSDGATLTSPSGLCPGAPFVIRFRPMTENLIVAGVRIGPMPADYASLSVPLDFPDTVMTGLEVESDHLFVGGCGDVQELDATQPSPMPGFEALQFPASQQRYGFFGLFDQIPTPCATDGGAVGLAETRAPAPWGRVVGPSATVTRAIVAGSYSSLQFFRNTKLHVHNVEASFGAVKKGDVVTLAEEIRVD